VNIKKIRRAAGVAACLGSLAIFSVPAFAAVTKAPAGGGGSPAKKKGGGGKKKKPPAPSPITSNDAVIQNGQCTIVLTVSGLIQDGKYNLGGGPYSAGGTPAGTMSATSANHGAPPAATLPAFFTVDNEGDNLLTFTLKPCHVGTWPGTATLATTPFTTINFTVKTHV